MPQRLFPICFLILSLVLPIALKAHQLHAQTPQNAFQLAIEKGDALAFRTACQNWYEANACQSAELNWHYNALMSVEAASLLLLPDLAAAQSVWALQYALNVRPEVAIVPLELSADPAYQKLFRQLHPEFQLPQGNKTLLNFQVANPGKKIYLSVAARQDMLQAEQGYLYLTGLAMQYTQIPFDNIQTLQFNFENRFLLDYLRVALLPEQNPERIAALNLNYIPALLLLHEHYEKQAQPGKAEAMRALAFQIAEAGGKAAEIRRFFTPVQDDPPARIPVKPIDKMMKKVGGQLYACETETSREQYDLFLQDLLRNRNYESLDRYKPKKTDWDSLLPDSLKQLPRAEIFRHGHPEDPNMPIQNISFEAAQAYCRWLTEAYNASADKKKKFKKVQFRLPAAAEWESAARFGIEPDAPYPWKGGYYVRNSKGCYLLNLNASEACKGCGHNPGEDGGIFTVAVGTYFPNNAGLYNICGNVAEMCDQKGISKGGSWADPSMKCQIPANGNYTNPEPTLGFRIFMEVIEE